MRMEPNALRSWRREARERLVRARLSLAAEALDALHTKIDAFIERAFPGLAGATLALCWPIRNEFDARPLARRLRDKGALTALPVVVAPGRPLVFREWHPGTKLERGPLDIPYPIDSPEVVPDAVLLPMNGWDMQGYRLGYGGGFFDRTLAAAPKKPLVIGVTYEMARLETIHPQRWDVPVDWLVTERGIYRRDPEGLAFLGAPPAGAASSLASPVCYAAEVAPNYFGEKPE